MTVIQTVDGSLLRSTPPAPTTQARYIVSEGPGSVPLAGGGTITFEAIAEQNPVAAAVIAKLTKQIATLPIRVFRGEPDGDRERLEAGDSLVDLLRKPAPRASESHLKEWLARPFFVHGNGLVAKYRPNLGEPPEALLPVPWPYVSAFARFGGPVEWWLTYQTGQPRYFSVDDSIHLAWGSSNIHGLGVSPLKPLADTISLDFSARSYQQSSFTNGGRPGSALVPPPEFRYKEGQREELRKEIARMHGGPDNAFNIALLAPGFDWKTIAQTAVEAEVIAARTLNREEIAMVYDVPPPMIGDLTHGTYSNVEELHRILYVTTLRPHLRRIEETIKAQVIDSEPAWAADNRFVEFDLSEVLRGNRREEIDAISDAFVNGLLTLNEARQELGMNRIEDIEEADEPFVAANNMRPLRGMLDRPDDATAPPGTDPNAVRAAPATPQPPLSSRALPMTPSPGD